MPAFLARARQVIVSRRAGRDDPAGSTDPDFGEAMRHIGNIAEVFAIPSSVVLGFLVPSAAMLALDHPVAILVWLSFPSGFPSSARLCASSSPS